MVTLGQIYKDLDEQKIALYPYEIGGPKALTMEMLGRYAIFFDWRMFTTLAEINQALVHEIGHCATGATHRVYSRYDLVEKHEYKANRFAIERYLPWEEIEDAMQHGLTEPWQLADWFGLPQQFIEKALFHYINTRQHPFSVNNAVEFYNEEE